MYVTFITEMPESIGEGREGSNMLFIMSSSLKPIHCLIITSIHFHLAANELGSFVIYSVSYLNKATG